MLKIIIITVVVVVTIFLTLLNYYGFFKKLQVVQSDFDECWFVYKTCVGPYNKTAATSDSIYYDLLNNEKIETYKGMSIYYDNPKETSPDSCRSAIGCILDPKDLDKIETLKEKFQVIQLEKRSSYGATLPYKGTVSVIVGVLRAYPALSRFMQDLGKESKPVAELCDVPVKSIFYYTGFTPALPSYEELNNQ